MRDIKCLDVHQRVAFVIETRTAVDLIDAGLYALSRLDGANDDSHTPMQLLAQGLERLLKLTWIACTFENTGAMPGSVKGHNLEVLLERVLGCASANPGYASRPAIQDDLAFMRSDAAFRALLSALSGFAQRDRYHDLNVILGSTDSKQPSASPTAAWSEVENVLLARHPEWRSRLGDVAFSGWWPVFVHDATALVHRFARAVCRMWTFGPAGRLGTMNTGTVGRYLYLGDDELGTRSLK